MWTLSSAAVAVYLYTLWTENGLLRARSYALGLGLGLVALIANVMLLMPYGFGAVAAVAYGLTAITSALVLGLVSGAMLFGHWYQIDLEMPVDYLRTFVRTAGNRAGRGPHRARTRDRTARNARQRRRGRGRS